MSPKRGRVSNSVSADEARRMSALEELPWSEFEKKVSGAIRANSWNWWQDRVIPAGAFTSLSLPRPALSKVLKVVNSFNRKKGLVDRLLWKEFESTDQIPTKLLQSMGYVQPYYLEHPLVVFGAVEIKTGAATETKEQDEFLRAAALCPGMFSLTVYPQGYDMLCEMLGGERP